MTKTVGDPVDAALVKNTSQQTNSTFVFLTFIHLMIGHYALNTYSVPDTRHQSHKQNTAKGLRTPLSS